MVTYNGSQWNLKAGSFHYLVQQNWVQLNATSGKCAGTYYNGGTLALPVIGDLVLDGAPAAPSNVSIDATVLGANFTLTVTYAVPTTVYNAPDSAFAANDTSRPAGVESCTVMLTDAISVVNTSVAAKTVKAPLNTVVFEQVADNLEAATQYGALVVCTNAAGTGFNSTTSKSAITPMPAPLDARITPQAGSVSVSFVLSAFYTGLSDWRKQYTYCNVTLSSGGKAAFGLTPALNATALPEVNVTFKSDTATAGPSTATYEASIYCNDTGSGAPSLIASAVLKPTPPPAPTPAPAPAPKRERGPKPAPEPGAAPSPGEYDYEDDAAPPPEEDDYEYDYFVSNHPPADDGTPDAGGDGGDGGGADGGGDGGGDSGDDTPEER